MLLNQACEYKLQKNIQNGEKKYQEAINLFTGTSHSKYRMAIFIYQKQI